MSVYDPLELGSVDLPNGIGLCLSGAGNRGALFNLGTVWNLHDRGMLPVVRRVDSTAGGSIVSAQLGLTWANLVATPGDTTTFLKYMVQPLRRLFSQTIGQARFFPALRFALAPSGDLIERGLRRSAFNEARLSDLQSDLLLNFIVTDFSSGERLVIGRSDALQELKLSEVVAGANANSPHWIPYLIEANVGCSLTIGTGALVDALAIAEMAKDRPEFDLILVSDGGAFYPKVSPDPPWSQPFGTASYLLEHQARASSSEALVDGMEKFARVATLVSLDSAIERFMQGGKGKESLGGALSPPGGFHSGLSVVEQNAIIALGYFVANDAIVQLIQGASPQIGNEPHI